MNSRLTLDYGMRFTRQQPQYDQFLQMSNFFPEHWSSAATRRCSTSPGCTNGAITCSGNARNAMNPRTGQILTAPARPTPRRRSARRSRARGNLTNGIHQAGNGIANNSYTWPTHGLGPRFGVAYDLTGNAVDRPARRRRAVLRPSGRQHGLLDSRQPADRHVAGPAQRPAADARHAASARAGVPALIDFQYNAKVPVVVAVERAASRWRCPGRRRSTLSYVGNHGYNRLARFQGGTPVNLNAVDFGTAYLPQNQDPTLGRAPCPARTRTRQPAASVPRLGNINQQEDGVLGQYHSIQMSLNRRFRNGLAFGVNYTLGLSFKGNTGLQDAPAARRRRHDLVRADQARVRGAEREPRLADTSSRLTAVWDMPDLQVRERRACRLWDTS